MLFSSVFIHGGSANMFLFKILGTTSWLIQNFAPELRRDPELPDKYDLSFATAFSAFLLVGPDTESVLPTRCTPIYELFWHTTKVTVSVTPQKDCTHWSFPKLKCLEKWNAHGLLHRVGVEICPRHVVFWGNWCFQTFLVHWTQCPKISGTLGKFVVSKDEFLAQVESVPFDLQVLEEKSSLSFSLHIASMSYIFLRLFQLSFKSNSRFATSLLPIAITWFPAILDGRYRDMDSQQGEAWRRVNYQWDLLSHQGFNEQQYLGLFDMHPWLFRGRRWCWSQPSVGSPLLASGLALGSQPKIERPSSKSRHFHSRDQATTSRLAISPVRVTTVYQGLFVNKVSTSPFLSVFPFINQHLQSSSKQDFCNLNSYLCSHLLFPQFI